MCRRWRRIALRLPASLSLEPLLPLLRKRRITALSVSGCLASLPVALPASLIRTLSRRLHRWVRCMLLGPPPASQSAAPASASWPAAVS